MKVGELSILVTGSSLGVERDTSPAVAWLIFLWWVSRPASQPPVQIAQRTSSYKRDFASLLWDVLRVDTVNRWTNSSYLLLFSFVSHLLPLKLMLLQCDSHMYYVGHKTNSAYAVFYIIQFYNPVWGNVFFKEPPYSRFLQLNHFMCDKWRVDMHQKEKNENKLWKKRRRRKKKLTTMADQYIQICVVWLLLSCSGLY